MFLLKICLTVLLWGLFIYAVFNTPYPNSLPEASAIQLASFFIPLFLALAATINLVFKNIPSSAIAASGLISLLTLKALGALNFLSGLLTFLAVMLLLSYFKNPISNLTSQPFNLKLRGQRRRK